MKSKDTKSKDTKSKGTKATAVKKTSSKKKSSKKSPGLHGGQHPTKKLTVKMPGPHPMVDEDLSSSHATDGNKTAPKMKATSIACQPEGIEHLLTTMAENLTAATCHREACRRLAHIATDDVVACNAIFANGGIERILAAMAKHPKTQEVLFHALAALDFLANDSEKQANIVKEEGVERIFLPCRRLPEKRILA
jgi:hypothetical protein